jgi:hypothetical protein
MKKNKKIDGFKKSFYLCRRTFLTKKHEKAS